MTTVLLVIQILIAVALVGVVLIQRSEGGGLGIGGGTAGGFMTTRGTANLLTRTTAALAALFMLTSLGLAWMHSRGAVPASRSILDAPAAPAAPAQPTAPAAPSVPLSR